MYHRPTFDSTSDYCTNERPWDSGNPDEPRVLIVGTTVPTALLAGMIVEFCTAVTLAEFDTEQDDIWDPIPMVSPDDLVPDGVSRRSGLATIDVNEFGVRAEYDDGETGYYDVAIVRRGTPPIEVSGQRVFRLVPIEGSPETNTAVALARVGVIVRLLAPSDTPRDDLRGFDCDEP